VRYETAAAFRTALEQRLLRTSRETGLPLVRLRKLVVFDRLLARLQVVAPGQWMLKGAVALLFRAGPHFRTTLDIDFARKDDEERATADFVAAQGRDLGDYFSFQIERTDRLDAALEGAAVRYRARTELAGRPFEDVTIDVGFGNSFEASPEVVRGPDLLDFAEIPPVEVPVLPLAQHVAEKLHAYTRVYEGGRRSSRVKDLVDLALIESLFEFRAGQLRRAIESTFLTRGSQPVPARLPPPPGEWQVPYRRMAREVGLDEDLSAAHDQASRFLNPLLAGVCSDEALWNPKGHAWG
jgi:hypothetical protein